MPHAPPAKEKPPRKHSPTKPAQHAPASTNPVNLVSFTFAHPPSSFISKSDNINLKKYKN